MKKRKILALLLTGLITASSLPFNVIAEEFTETDKTRKETETIISTQDQEDFDLKKDQRQKLEKLVQEEENKKTLQENEDLKETLNDLENKTKKDYKENIEKESIIKLEIDKTFDKTKDKNITINGQIDLEKIEDKEIKSYILVLQKGLKLQEEYYKEEDQEKIKNLLEDLDRLEEEIKTQEEKEEKKNKEEEFTKTYQELETIKPSYSLKDLGYKIDQDYTKEEEKYLEENKKDPNKYPLKYGADYYSLKLIKDPKYKDPLAKEIKLMLSLDGKLEKKTY